MRPNAVVEYFAYAGNLYPGPFINAEFNEILEAERESKAVDGKRDEDGVEVMGLLRDDTLEGGEDGEDVENGDEEEVFEEGKVTVVDSKSEAGDGGCGWR
ncbi:hypothetical protein HK097_003558 [Rhizophlyctis rosea]|uniref:Uncharacterized protein n=1 Tax=Rhizophlyctis rosea TaxID=64517 RepID=A0AAD5X0I9_9FUNG|nr:hypothetical protein HK097_003558 [Rhizophlyctis rosea]